MCNSYNLCNQDTPTRLSKIYNIYILCKASYRDFTVSETYLLRARIRPKRVYHHLLITSLEIKRLGERYNRNDLTRSATNYLLQHFDTFKMTDDFLQMTPSELGEMLDNDELNTDSEDELMLCIIRWKDYRPVDRMFHVDNLFKKLRYPLMRIKSIQLMLSNVQELSCQLAFFLRECEKRCLQFHTTGNASTLENCDDGFSKYSLNRRQRIPPHLIFMMGGWNRGRILDLAECYNSRTDRWSSAPHLRDPAGGRGYFGMEVMDGSIYVIGKHAISSATIRYIFFDFYPIAIEILMKSKLKICV